MPWRIVKRGSKHCVIKEGESRPVPGGCHSTRADAVKHQRALYVSERRPSKTSSSGATVTAIPEVTEVTMTNAEVAVLEDGPVKIAEEEVEETAVNEEEGEASATLTWEGILAVEGMATDDGRYLIPGEIGAREPMPRPLQVQFATSGGHEGAVVVGGIDLISHIPVSDFDKEDFDLKDVPEQAVVIWGEGHIEDNEDGRKAVEMVENGAGISLDLPPSRHALIDPETLEEVDPKELDPEEVLIAAISGEYLTGYAGNIAAATICTVPAFPAARLRIMPTSKEQVLVASAFGQRVIKMAALTAAAAGKAPLKPPRDWFFTPETKEPTPLTVTPEGKVYGHLALWGQCHVAFAGCEVPNPSRSNYAWFHLGQIETAEGELIDVGRITVGRGGNAKGGHASIIHGTQGALEHYDDTGCVAAFVRAVDGHHGVWLAGAVRSDVPAERIRDLRANPPSLDYRIEGGHRELVAVLSVPVPGFPIPRSEMRLVASGVVEEVTAAIVTGYWPDGEEPEKEQEMSENGKAELRRRRAEQMRADAFKVEFGFELESEDFQKITAEQRRKWAKSGAALNDGSFPITKCSGEGPSAENAIRAQGRAPEAKRGRVKAHIRKRVRSLGCSGDIFEPYR